MNIQEKLAELQEQLRLSDGPPGWKKIYLVHPGETPWWKVEGCGEQIRVGRRQRQHRHPELCVEATTRYQKSHPEVIKKYRKTPKGRAIQAKETAKRRKRSIDPALYAARVELLHALNESCNKCHAPYDITHQIDHIIPLFVGGTDEWSNLQPLCILCHRKKSAEDRRKYR